MEDDIDDLLSDYKLCGFMPVVLASSNSSSHLAPGTTCRPHSFSNSVYGFITRSGDTLIPVSEENANESSSDPKPKKRRGKRSRIQMMSGSVVDQIRTLSGNHCLKVVGTIQRVSVRNKGEVRAVVVADVYLPVGVWCGWQFTKSSALAASFFKHVSCDWEMRTDMLSTLKDDGNFLNEDDQCIWYNTDCHVLGCSLHSKLSSEFDSAKKKLFDIHDIFKSLPTAQKEEKVHYTSIIPDNATHYTGIWDVNDDLLTAILAKLSLRSLSCVSSTCRHLRYLALPVMPCMKLKLFPHQQAAVDWMLKRERHPSVMPHPLYMSFSTSDGCDYYINSVSGKISTDVVPKINDFCGGMFCDEPGLGKTITALSLILKTHGMVADPPNGVKVTWCKHNHAQRCGYYELNADDITNLNPMLKWKRLFCRRGEYTLGKIASGLDLPRTSNSSSLKRPFDSIDNENEEVPYSSSEPLSQTGGLRSNGRAGHVRRNLLDDLQRSVVACNKKPRKKSNNTKRNKSKLPEISNADVTDSWVQCDSCRKWRRLCGKYIPDDTAAWFCSMNTDQLHQSCAVPEEIWDRKSMITYYPGFYSKESISGNNKNTMFFVSILKEHFTKLDRDNIKALEWLATLSNEKFEDMETKGLSLPVIGIYPDPGDEPHGYEIIFQAFGLVRQFKRGRVIWFYPPKLENLVFDSNALQIALTKSFHSSRFYLSRATLIVVPANLVEHWKTQIRKHIVPDLLSIFVWADNVKPSAHSLAWDYDIVITTFNRLSAEWGPRKLSVLTQIHWFRVILDEGHTLGSSVSMTNKLQMAISLVASRRWILTGTPTPNTPSSQLTHLQPMLKFLHDEVYGQGHESWDAGILKPFEAEIEEARSHLLHLLRRIMISARKKDLKNIPPCIKNVILLDFNEEHARSYNELVVTVRRNILMADWNDPSHVESLLNPKQWKFRSNTIRNIRLSCCVSGHIKVTEAGNDIQDTMDLLVQRGLNPLSEYYGLIRVSLLYGGNCMSRFMNQYFLLIACLQLWSLITPVNPASTWGPLIFIFSVSATKEAWDDYNRYLSDKKANEKEVWVVKHGNRKHIQAQDIHVGNIVWLRENDEVPCDLVLIGTSESQGICYVETSALDGETDLKTRVIPDACIGLPPELLYKMKGIIECPNPDKDIRQFDANLRLFPPFIDNDLCPLSISNTLLQSCYLRNTEWACGISVYTGNETKLGMSRGIPEPKLTAVDAMIDKLTGAIFLFQIVVVVVLGIAGNVWKDTEARKLWYVMYPIEKPWYELLIIPLRFELLCSIMIPISIKVSLDLVKGLYAKFIDWDELMYDLETKTPSHATNTAISEDLGQVEYILTDKTGTLTENKMVFKRCCISGTYYGNESGDALKDISLLDAISGNTPDVIRFLMIMAICNTVVPVKCSTGNICYKAQSQDEEALVNAANLLHMSLTNKNGSVLDVNFNGRMIQYEILDILEFTSDRKRMSVVVKDLQNGVILLLTKGADEVILPYASHGQQVRIFFDAVEQYAQLGLRTLCFGCRELEDDEYRNWASLFKEANSTLIDREWKLAEVCQKLERDLKIIGVTAIEDRLQEGVTETIETLRKAGINFWMLTGDKQSTAIQIALSCNFISPEPKGQLLMITGKTVDEVLQSIERILLTIRITTSEPKEVAFVVDGWALEIALRYHKSEFTSLAILSRTAICCRTTPSQKAQLVALLKSCDYRTLAIGDGGNDVRMIQHADIGVGISGREGLQAARAADYSIGKFRFLKRLILVHGRYSYNRTAFLSQYSFYKSLLICFIQILFSLISGMSGSSLFNSFSLMAYNVFYTSIPVLTSVLDKDLSENTVMQNPQILFYCQAGRILNPSTFAGWFFRSLFHAVVVFMITVHAYSDEKCELEELSMVVLSGCIWLQAFVVMIETNSFTLVQHLAIWGNLVGFYIINYILSAIPSVGMYTIMFRLCRQPSYWITLFLIVALGMGPVLAIKYFRYTYRPSKINTLQQEERFHGGRILTIEECESQENPLEKDLSPVTIVHNKNRNPVYEPLLSDSPTATRRSLGTSINFDSFQPIQPRFFSSHLRNLKSN